MRSDYLNYTINDFVWDEDFRSWVLNPNEVNDSYWVQWLSLHPEKIPDVEAAREIVSALKMQQPSFNAGGKDALIDDIVKKATGQKNHNLLNVKTLLAAASFIAIIIAAYLFLMRGNTTSHFDRTIKSALFENNRDSSVAVRLPDGTEVVLDTKAAVRLAPSFNRADRKVYLTGNAFFNVVRDTLKPFFVYCGNTETKVLGTSFKIQSDPLNKKIQVIVRSGIVSVSTPEKVKGKDIGLKTVIVTRNQQADYSIKTGSLSKTIAAVPQQSEENFINFIYEAKPVYEIFSELEKAYDISVLYDKSVIPNHNFSGDLEGKTLQEKMTVICHALGYNYKIEDAKIIVY